MKDESCNCGCVLVGRKFLNEDKTTNLTKLAILFEKWEKEQLILKIERRHVFTVINSYAQNLCQCECHVIKTIKKEK